MSKTYFIAATIIILFSSCNKTDIIFGSAETASDPNITYIDNFPVELATYKPDSFVTSAHSILVAGYHNDTALGVMKAASYLQLEWPESNPLLNENSTYDSLELLLRPSGQFYGDSSRPLTFKILQLAQNINSSNGDVYYNTSFFTSLPAPLAQKTIRLDGTTNSVVHIRLSDLAGLDLFNKFKTGDEAVSSTEKFTDYFKGLCITADSMQTNTVAYFTAKADSALVKLHYHVNGLFAESKELSFKYSSSRQFNNIGFRFTKTGFTALNGSTSKLVSSTLTQNQAVLNSAYNGTVKISFSNLLSLKEQHPYVKIVKALLVIRPDNNSSLFPYQLPPTLNLYRTDNSNLSGAGVYESSSTGAALQDGSLYIDAIYGEDTRYTYDITSFINDKMSEGVFSQSALLLHSTQVYPDEGLQRIFLNNQQTSRPVQLRLYVLGL